MSEKFKIRVQRDFTIMPNHHLRNKNLSYKAKGLQSVMESLPEDWDYTIKGLAKLGKDGRDSVIAGLKELEQEGYLERRRLRNEKGQVTGTEYIIYPEPHFNCGKDCGKHVESVGNSSPNTENPTQEKPIQEKPIQDYPTQENPTQSNTNISNTNQSRMNIIKNLSINHPQANEDNVENYVENIKEQIHYEYLCSIYGSEEVDNVISIICEVITSKKDRRINKRKISYTEILERFNRINSECVMYVLDSIKATQKVKQIHNLKAYTISTLYNAIAIID